ncbi:MAG TPA: response regulator [Gemmatimonadaceae bacterium]|nr:response regulator [Gemmatimonadaceae bacterium]
MTDRSSQIVCVVDDDRSVRVALERLFRGVGWNVRSFASAEEFLDCGSHLGCACLVADVHLGRMSGLELQAVICAKPDAPMMILTSGLAEEGMEIEARRLGATAFFRKPFDVEALLDAVGRALERQ